MILIGREHIVTYVQQFPPAATALCMWQAIVEKAYWADQKDVIARFPTAKFLTPKIVCFYPIEIGCIVTAQIAFNSRILIVLAITEIQPTSAHGS